MNVLLIYPDCPDTFWSYKHALKLIAKKAAQPPLGLLTLAAMLPEEWPKKLVDMNVSRLKDSHLAWADTAFISGMSIQRDSAHEVIARCRAAGVVTVAGGPLFTANADEFPEVDHLVLNEAEATLGEFLKDFAAGRARARYGSEEFLPLEDTPIPRYELLHMRKYASMNIQYSRGCPFDCEFCDISALFGKKVRTKDTQQLLSELACLHTLKWRGSVFFVDDNFIGHRSKLKGEVLPALIAWMDANGHPFDFSTEASIDIADDPEMMDMMVQAGFESVFVGIETTNDQSLEECGKRHNRNRDLLESVKAIQRAGLQVMAGFILGFDNDPPVIFERVRLFIQTSGIVSAMVGLLNAPRNSRLHKRMQAEGRLLEETSGNNTTVAMNFIPRMDPNTLIDGYRRVVAGIYSPRPYYARVKQFLREFHPPRRKRPFRLVKFGQLVALAKESIVLGLVGKERFQYWRLFFWSLFRRPRLFPLAMILAAYGLHFRKSYEAGMLR